MMRLPVAYLVFVGIRVGVTLGVGWLAVDYLSGGFGHIADQVTAVAQRL
jgi:hypothetical protein